MTYIRSPNDIFYNNVYMTSGSSINTWIDSLGAYFPALQALMGDLPNAMRLYENYYSIWKMVHL
jgi:hypothetical protein